MSAHSEPKTNGVSTEEGEENDDQKPQKKAAKHDSGAADLEKVTDYAEEQEISSEDIDRVSDSPNAT